MVTRSIVSFNPLRIGSYCNLRLWRGRSRGMSVSIPLESGHIVIENAVLTLQALLVSIPLESGHIVI